MFPRLRASVEKRWGDVIARSGPVPWEVKRAAYREAALDPALHGALARGVAGSFHDVFGSVDPVEARALFQAIRVDDEDVQRFLDVETSRPVRWRLHSVIVVDEKDPRFTKWLRATGPTFLAVMSSHPHDGGRAWVAGADLVHAGRTIGRLAHHTFPFDPTIRHEVFGAPYPEKEGQKGVLFRIEGDAALARRALGEEVEAWAPGLLSVARADVSARG